ncbi:MAG: lysylphosphatidylglycerol synthase transmembrane domain-containing protein [Gemmatimonadota bacterium]|nr:lysylphosphatidylglycerol synthase transmembrane domain-containing protein [Gemmatimonadota bacterium]
MGHPDGAAASPLSPRNVAIGLALFVVFTLGGLAVVAWWARRSDAAVVSEITHASPRLLLVALLFLVVDVTAGALRVWVLAREALPGFRVRDGLRTHLYLLFAGGVTPMQLGGGPAQYVVLRARGLPPHDALAVLSISWIGGLAALGLLGGGATAYLVAAGRIDLGALLGALLVTVAFVVLVGLAVTVFPSRVTRWLHGIRGMRRGRVGHRVLRAAARYRRTIRLFGRSRRTAWAVNASLNIVMVLLRCAAGVAIAAALGVLVPPVEAVARQTIQFAVISVAPSPAGSGVAELTSVGLMAALVPPGLLVAWTVLWRLFTSYLGVLAGAFVVVLDLVSPGQPGPPGPGPARRER